jgi:glutaredoxin-like YruB-family protein
MMKIYRLPVVCCALILICAASSSAQIYKWVDDKGVAHFSDSPPLNSSEAIEDQEAASSDSDLPGNSPPAAESQNAALDPDFFDILKEDPEASEALEEPSVEIYTTSWCVYCKKAKQFFRSKGIEFVEYDIEKDKNAARRMMALTSKAGVPFVVINGQGIQGYSAEAYQAALQN